MTKNRAQPTRYRPGKAETQDAETSSEEDSASEAEDQNVAPKPPATRPAATSFPAQQQKGKKLAIDARRVGAQTSLPVSHSRQAGKEGRDDLEGFVTASESSASGDERSNDEAEAESASSDSEQDDSDDDDSASSSFSSSSSSSSSLKKPLLRPTFLSKAQRLAQTSTTTTPATQTTTKPSEPDTLRKQKADDLLRIQLERDAAAKAAGKKSWDDEDFAPEEEVDDTDNLDRETEYAAWKLRELKRVRRERLLIEEREKEKEEVERRRNLTAEEREAEDRAFVAAQQQAAEEGEEGGRGKMGYMQKYFHGGAFFNSEAGKGEGEPDAEVQAALNRSFAGAKFEDETGDKSVLPQYMRIRDMTRLGRKGRTKYQDLKSEDTGRWGAGNGRRREDGGGGGDSRGLDERFRPDDSGRERERTGANSIAVGERRRFEGDNGGRDEKRARYG